MKKLFPEIAKTLEELPDKERKEITSLFGQLHLSYSLQKEFLSYFTEISARDGVKIEEILLEIKDILGSALTKERKAAFIRKYLKSRRFPLLTKAEECFKECLNNLGIPKWCEIVPPSYFEGNEYQIRMKFKGAKDFQSKVDYLQKLSQKPDWKKLIEETWFESLFTSEDTDR